MRNTGYRKGTDLMTTGCTGKVFRCPGSKSAGLTSVSTSQRLKRLYLVAPLLTLLCLFVAPAHALTGELPDFTSLVEQSHEAVVNISTTSASESGGEQPFNLPDLDDSPLGDLLRKYLEEQQQAPRGREEGDSLGSGFIISSDGYVLTNNHVIAAADEIIVRLHDRRQLVAKLVGADPQSDVALLKVEATDLPVVRIGSADSLKVGEWVLAIGSPFGFDFSVTAGIVSAKGRALPRENYVPFIQTDVAINPGNSGGPLFNLRGEVIGVNSQIYSRTGGFMGLAFAIPIEMAMDVADQLKSSGRVSRGWLGVVIQEVTRELAESFGMNTAYGALVSRILPGSPASKSELRVGDVITEFNGNRVERSSALPPLVGRVRVDVETPLQVVRNGETVELSVVIGELPGDEELREAANQQEPSTGANPFKMKIGELADDARTELGIDKGGVLVTEVMMNGPADAAGIQPGDALLMVDNKPIDSLSDFDNVILSLDDQKSVAVLVHRADGPVFLALQLSE